MILRILGLSILALFGCAEEQTGPSRFALKGKVTVDGVPVPAGTVTFEPDAEKANTGPMTLAKIKDGAYETPPLQGVVGGPHKIMIDAYDGTGTPGTSNEDGKALNGSPFTQKGDLPKSDGTFDIEITVKKK